MVAATAAAPAEQPFFALDPVELDISFGSPPRQSRVTVAFRILLALPHFVALWVLGLVAVLLVVVGWFAALVLGRLPRWIARYEMGVIAYSTRVNAYAYLLADKFPPFGFSAADYSIGVKIGASRLSRLKVLFRWLLVIPAHIVNLIALNRLLVLSPIIWLTTLVLGRTPQSFFGAAAAVIRYQARYYAYIGLVTDDYPHGLFEPQWVSAPGLDGELRPLSEGARRLLVLIIVLGIAAVFVGPVWLRPASSSSAPVAAIESRLAHAIAAYPEAIRGCGTSSNAFGCVKAQDRVIGEAFSTFAASVSRVSFPDSKRAQVSAVVHEGREIGHMFVAASKSKTLAGRDKALHNLDRLIAAFEEDAPSVFGHKL